MIFSKSFAVLSMLITLITHSLIFDSYTIISFILIIIFSINDLIRFNYLNPTKPIFIFSLILDLSLACLIYSNIQGLFFPFIFAYLMDICFLDEKISKYLLTSILLFTSLIIVFTIPNPHINLYLNLAINMTFIFITFLGSQILSEQFVRKNEAQVLYDKLRVSEEKLQAAYDDLSSYNASLEELTLLRERARISRELHDSVGHSLSTLIIQLNAVKSLIEINPKACGGMLDELVTFTKTALENTRRAVRELKPMELEKYGFILSIKELCKKFEYLTNIKIKLLFSKESWNVNSDQGHQIYRIIQEALNNSARHGHSTEVNIILNFSDEKLFISIKDNGIGTDTLSPSFGMKGMADRVETLKGTIDFESKKDTGFSIYINIPKEGNNFYD